MALLVINVHIQILYWKMYWCECSVMLPIYSEDKKQAVRSGIPEKSIKNHELKNTSSRQATNK